MAEERIINKIQALLDRASNTPFEAEADACRAKADELMTIYTIQQAELDAHRPRNEREQVEDRFMTVCGAKHAAKYGMMLLVSAVMVHCRVKALHYSYDSKYLDYKVRMYGFPSDLDYAEALFTNLLLQLSKEMKPQYNPEESEVENLVRLKESGMKWIEIHPVLHPDVPFERKHGVRYTKLYTDYCKEHNRKRMYTSPQKFVYSFVIGFAEKINSRLWELQKRRAEQEESHGPGTALAVRDRYQEVSDFFDKVPKGGSLKANQRDLDYTAFGGGQEAGERADLGQPRMGGSRKAING